MRLKVSPYEAVKIINGLIRSATDIWKEIRDGYWSEYDKSLNSKDKEREKWRAEHQERPFGVFPAALQIPIPNHISVVSSALVDDYSKRYDEWVRVSQKRLEDIFCDEAPVHKFFYAKNDPDERIFGTHGDFLNLEGDWKGKFNVLVKVYDQISFFVRSPLVYLKDKAQIWFYDVSIPLKKDSNEAALCAFMFKFPLGEPVEFSDIYEAVKGVEAERPKNWKKVVSHAYDGINRKAKGRFGFHIFEKSGVTLTRSLPARIVASL
jgi:hypothetical protein